MWSHHLLTTLCTVRSSDLFCSQLYLKKKTNRNETTCVYDYGRLLIGPSISTGLQWTSAFAARPDCDWNALDRAAATFVFSGTNSTVPTTSDELDEFCEVSQRSVLVCEGFAKNCTSGIGRVWSVGPFASSTQKHELRFSFSLPYLFSVVSTFTTNYLWFVLKFSLCAVRCASARLSWNFPVCPALFS